MTIDEIKKYIAGYCDDCGSCDNCALNLPGAPNNNSCYTHCTKEELIENYNWIREWS